jgi:hypothetical protein
MRTLRSDHRLACAAASAIGVGCLVTIPPLEGRPDAAAPFAACGNGHREVGEACDGADLGGLECRTVASGLVSGTLRCTADCREYDVAACSKGAVTAARDCSATSVEQAILEAAEGGTVSVPPGTCTWDRDVTLASKSLTVRGAGVGATTLILGAQLVIEGADKKPFRITGLSFTQLSGLHGIRVSSNATSFRIDHCSFESSDFGADSIFVGGGIAYGVIDHVDFTRAAVHLEGPLGATGRTGHDGDASWALPPSFGTAGAVFIEDCSFQGSGPTDRRGALSTGGGARYVFRHNAARNAPIYSGGTCVSPSRGTFGYEIYENVLTIDDTIPYVPIQLRGGTGVVFDNRLDADANRDPFIYMATERSCPTQDCGDWGICDGSGPYDGKPDGYPCLDQIGRSTDGEGGAQLLEPLYAWNNTFRDRALELRLGCPVANQEPQIRAGRDYYDFTEKPLYVRYVYPHPLVAIPDD